MYAQLQLLSVVSSLNMQRGIFSLARTHTRKQLQMIEV